MKTIFLQTITNKINKLQNKLKPLIKLVARREAEEEESGFGSDWVGPTYYSHIDLKLISWTKQCRHLLQKLPLDSTPYLNLLELCDKKNRVDAIYLQELHCSLDAILEDLDDGLFDDFPLKIKAETALEHFEDAERLLDDGEMIYGGLIVVSVLEGFLKEIYLQIPTKKGKVRQRTDLPNTITDLVTHLKNLGLLSGKDQDKAKKWGRIRNYLAHGDYYSADKKKEFTENDIQIMLIQAQDMVRQLSLHKF